MRAFGMALIQVVIALLVSGLILPALLFSVPATRKAGPMVLIILIVLLFSLLRLAWPQSRTKTRLKGEQSD
jgi:hypothetical protein